MNLDASSALQWHHVCAVANQQLRGACRQITRDERGTSTKLPCSNLHELACPLSFIVHADKLPIQHHEHMRKRISTI